jgi:hypothetical protein
MNSLVPQTEGAMMFTSRHTLWLEKEIEDLKHRHEKEIEDLKKTHAEQVLHAIEENRSLRDELERTRIVLTPALQSAVLPKERDNLAPPSPPKEMIPRGTPWQRVQAQYFADLDAQDKLKSSRFVKPVDMPVEGDKNGNVREGRVETPLGQPGTDA